MKPDRIGPQKRAIQHLADELQAHMSLYGYRLIDTPVIDRADLFLTKAGDRIAEQLFTFERHGQVWALRPEFTAAAAYLYMTQATPQQPARWQFSGPVFRDTHLTGSDYQQYSAGAELIGVAGAAAEAEVIAMAAHGLLKLGIADWRLVIGHVGLTRRLLERHQLDPRTQRYILHQRELLRDGDAGRQRLLAQMQTYFPALSDDEISYETIDAGEETSAQNVLGAMLATSHNAVTMGGRTRQDIARRLSQKRRQAAQHTQIEDALNFLVDWMQICNAPQTALDAIAEHIRTDETAGAMLRDLGDSLDLLRHYQIPHEQIIIQPDLARSWDYYTGTLFEIRTDEDVLLAGGGRYDELTRLLGAETGTPAFGFAYEVESIARLRPSHDSEPLFYLVIHPDQAEAAIRWAQMLRLRNVHVALVETAPDDATVMTTDENGSIILDGRAYTADEVERLVTTLRGR